MRASLIVVALCLAAGSVAAAKDAKDGTLRQHSIKECNAQASKQWPGKYYDWDATQSFTYRTCMFEHAERP